MSYPISSSGKEGGICIIMEVHIVHNTMCVEGWGEGESREGEEGEGEEGEGREK